MRKRVTITCPACSGFGGFRLVLPAGHSQRKLCQCCQGTGLLVGATPTPPDAHSWWKMANNLPVV